MTARNSAVLLACIGVVLALGGVARSEPATPSAATQGNERLLATARPVTTLAADGSIAAVSTGCGEPSRYQAHFFEEVA